MATLVPISFLHDPIIRPAASELKPGEDILQNTHHFPSFANLPEENDLDLDYWKESGFHRFVPACTWFFMAEITYDELALVPFLRNRVLVRDRDGKDDIPISFYPEDGYFNFRSLKKGHTVFVIQAEKHHFLDMTIGLRIEDLSSIFVVPCDMKELLSLSAIYHERKDTQCWSCKKKRKVKEKDNTTSSTPPGASGSSVQVQLLKCAACRVARYCGKECQIKDWKACHRKHCKVMPYFLRLTRIDYSKYDSHMHMFGPGSFPAAALFGHN